MKHPGVIDCHEDDDVCPWCGEPLAGCECFPDVDEDRCPWGYDDDGYYEDDDE